MCKYLESFTRIDENYRDTSEYYNYYSYCRYMLSTTNFSMEQALITGMCKFKNSILLHISYKLINEFYPQVNIPQSLVESHIAIVFLKDEIYKYLYIYYNEIFKKTLIDDLYNIDFYSANLVKLINKHYPEELEIFIRTENAKYALNQIRTMLCISKVTNIDYFVPFIGSENSLLCVKAGELLRLTIEQKTRSNILIIMGNFIRFSHKIHVECVANFIFYITPFIEEGKIINNHFMHNRANSIKTIIDQYVTYDDDIICNINQRHKFTVHIAITGTKDTYVSENTNFDFLFGKQTYKTFSDCIEI